MTRTHFKLLLIAISSILIMASCTKNEDAHNPAYTGETKLKMTLSQDLLDVANVSLEYTNENGQIKTETITSNFEKDVKYLQLPVQVICRLKVTLKESYPAQEKYDIACILKLSARLVKDGTISSLHESSVVNRTVDGVPASSLSQTITSLNAEEKLTISKDGGIVK